VLVGRPGVACSQTSPRPASATLRSLWRACSISAVRYLREIRHKHVALTGICWVSRKNLIQAIRSHGGFVTASADVTSHTDVLVRGYSPHWAYGDFGLKEAAAAARIRSGQQLAIVHDDEFRKLLEKNRPARRSDYVAGQPIAWLLPPPDKNKFDDVARIQGPLDREQTVQGRVEQGFLRGMLFQGRDRSTCSLCGAVLPTELLVAAHIKPRSECNSQERRDARNIAFPVCLLGCDALYERGFVSVNDKGQVVTTKRKGLPDNLQNRLQKLNGRRCSAWNDANAAYFSWHIQRRFRV